MNKEYLFIGGPADGKRLRANCNCTIDIPNKDVNNPDVKIIEYVKYTFAYTTNIAVYAPKNFTYEDIITRLVANYEPIMPSVGV